MTRVSGGRFTAVWGAAAAFAWAALAVGAWAQVSVETIGGGVRTECGASAGFKAGNTWTNAQFDLPYATALDSQSNLWVADKTNADVEEITQAGNRAASVTYEFFSGTNKHPFPGLISVAVDSSNTLYVLTTNTLYRYPNAPGSFPVLDALPVIALHSFSPMSATALAVANDDATNIYISFANSSEGTIIKIPQPYTGAHSVVVSNYAFIPSGLAIRSDGQLAVSDTLKSGVYVAATNTLSTPVLVTGGLGAGYFNGPAGAAKFNQPHGIVAASDGSMIVCDTKNNAVRVIDSNTNTTTLYGTLTNVWTETCCSCSPALYAGWVDGTSGNFPTNASSRLPVSVTIAPDSTLFVTEQYYNLIRAVTGSGFTPVSSSSSSFTNLPAVTTLAATNITATGGTLEATVNPDGSDTTVYFEWGTTTNYGSNTTSIILSTNLESSNSVSMALTGLQVGTVVYYQAVAINNGGTSDGGIRSFITTAAAASNQLGFLTSPSAGIGSTVYLPLALNLADGISISTLQFRVEVDPISNAPAISSLSLLPVTTNDFVQLAGPTASNAPVTLTVTPCASAGSANGAGLLVFAAPGSGVSIQNFGVVGLLQFQIPYNASTNQTYGLNVLYPSGSTTNVITALNQILTVADLPYLAGDCYPPNGYNAEEFGDGALDNNDVDSIIYASMGIHVPPLYSDAFNAMDVSPQTAGINGDNGDGQLRYQDWNEVLLRSVALDPTNWVRSWTNGGYLVGTPYVNGLGLPGNPVFTPKAVQSAPPGLVWFCPASIGAGTMTDALPGSTCSVPVYANVRTNYSLSGLQFRAVVSPNGDAPPVGAVTFTQAASMPAPILLSGLSANDVPAAWELGSFASPLVKSNYLGVISFQVPSNALAGQSYAVHFLGVDASSADNSTAYAMESFPGFVWVGSKALQTPSITSDEWKIRFFGSLTNSLAGDNVDADGDGMRNWQEYLAGTDPTNPDSVLRFGGGGCFTNGTNGLVIGWLTAPGKTYILESMPAFGGHDWMPVNTNLGNGYMYQFIQNNISGNAAFYRIRLQP
jgi:hypothetical protein